MKKYSATKARDQFSELLQDAANGFDVVIEKFGKPVAILMSPEKYNACESDSMMSVAICPWSKERDDLAGISVHRSLADAIGFVSNFSSEQVECFPVSKDSIYMCNVPKGLFLFDDASSYHRILESDLHLYGFGRKDGSCQK